MPFKGMTMSYDFVFSHFPLKFSHFISLASHFNWLELLIVNYKQVEFLHVFSRQFNFTFVLFLPHPFLSFFPSFSRSQSYPVYPYRLYQLCCAM